jgi:hypothetical protein
MKGNLIGTLKGLPGAEERRGVSRRAFVTAPDPAIGQHFGLVNLHIVGIAGEDAP